MIAKFFRSCSCPRMPGQSVTGLAMRRQAVDSTKEISLFQSLTKLARRFKSSFQRHRIREGGSDALHRLTTIPGVGKVSTLTVHAFAPTMDSFARGRDFAAWIGLTPREFSTGGRHRPGRITRTGQRDLRQPSLVVSAPGNTDFTDVDGQTGTDVVRGATRNDDRPRVSAPSDSCGRSSELRRRLDSDDRDECSGHCRGRLEPSCSR